MLTATIKYQQITTLPICRELNQVISVNTTNTVTIE